MLIRILVIYYYIILLFKFFTAHQRSCRNVMFSGVSVKEGVFHLTITQNALDLTVQTSSPAPSPLTTIHGPSSCIQEWHLLITYDGQNFRTPTSPSLDLTSDDMMAIKEAM